MKKSELTKVEPRKITIGLLVKFLGKILAWIGALTFILASIQAFSTSQFLYGAVALVVGMIVLPLSNTILRKYANIEISGGIKIILVIAALLFIGLFQVEPPQKTYISGANFETAIVVKASDEKTGVAWEYQYLRANACKKDGYMKVLGQSLEKKAGHFYDRVAVACRDNTNEAYYFNIDNFFGKI